MTRAAALFLLLAASCARTKPLTVDDLDRDIPHRPLEEACAAFPPPFLDDAFVFAADIYVDGETKPQGSLQVAVEAGTFHEEPAWFVDEKWDETGHGLPAGARQVKHARTWLARDLRLLGATVDVDVTRPGAAKDHVHTEFGPTATGYWVAIDRGDGSSTREESPGAGPDWARSFAGAMVFLRLCPAESALYAGRRGDYVTVRAQGDGTMTVSGFASMAAKVRVADRALLEIEERVWELTPRRFVVRGTPR